jgi:hypothetical protein
MVSIMNICAASYIVVTLRHRRVRGIGGNLIGFHWLRRTLATLGTPDD